MTERDIAIIAKWSIDELKPLFQNGHEFTGSDNAGHHLDDNWPTFDIDDQPDDSFTAWIAISPGKSGFWCRFDEMVQSRKLLSVSLKKAGPADFLSTDPASPSPFIRPLYLTL